MQNQNAAVAKTSEKGEMVLLGRPISGLPVLKDSRMKRDHLLWRTDRKGIFIERLAREELLLSSASMNTMGKGFEHSVPELFSVEHLGTTEKDIRRKAKEFGLGFYGHREILHLADQYDQPAGENLFIIMPVSKTIIVLMHDDRGRRLEGRESFCCGGQSQLLLKRPLAFAEAAKEIAS